MAGKTEDDLVLRLRGLAKCPLCNGVELLGNYSCVCDDGLMSIGMYTAITNVLLDITDEITNKTK